MKLPQTEILVLLRQLPGFADLLFDELQLLVPLVEEVAYAPDSIVTCLEGHSIVYKGTITRGNETFTRGMLLPQLSSEALEASSTAEHQEVTRSLDNSILLHLSENRIHALMRREPELTMFVMEHLQQLNSESGTDR